MRSWIPIALLAASGLTLASFSGVGVPGTLALQASGEPSAVGQWSEPMDWPLVGVHAALLPTGKVLHYSYPQTGPGAEAWLWDPEGGTLGAAPINRNIFCSSQAFLPDGRLLVTGGTDPGSPENTPFGLKDIHTFDPSAETWTHVADMQVGRWYPTSVALPDGRTLVVSGLDEQSNLTDLVEVYDPTSGSQVIPGANRFLDLYPRMHVLPSGKVLHVGSEELTSAFDPASATWQEIGFSNYGYRGEGTSVLLPLQPPDYRAEVLTLGGGNPATATAEIMATGDPHPSWRFTASMNQARRHPNAVLLPDGEVLVIGGGLTDEAESPILDAEIFDPVSETWSAVASMQRPRVYHSTAILLPDGRVLAAGSDGEYTAEIYSPPYLFQGSRPQMSSAPDATLYGGSFQVTTPDAQDIASIVLIRPAAVTHSVNTDQRYVELEFEAGTDLVTVQAPPSANLAPPGYYMLFIVNSDGVPSEAMFIQLGSSIDSDNDGFSDAIELFVGTDENLACGPVAWPPDFNDDQIVTISDVLALKPAFNSQSDDPNYDSRLDLSADGRITISDVLALRPVFNQSCAPSSPPG